MAIRTLCGRITPSPPDLGFPSECSGQDARRYSADGSLLEGYLRLRAMVNLIRSVAGSLRCVFAGIHASGFLNPMKCGGSSVRQIGNAADPPKRASRSATPARRAFWRRGGARRAQSADSAGPLPVRALLFLIDNRFSHRRRGGLTMGLFFGRGRTFRQRPPPKETMFLRRRTHRLLLPASIGGSNWSVSSRWGDVKFRNFHFTRDLFAVVSRL